MRLGLNDAGLIMDGRVSFVFADWLNSEIVLFVCLFGCFWVWVVWKALLSVVSFYECHVWMHTIMYPSYH